MSLELKNQSIKEGKDLLRQGIFPNEVLAKVKEPRLRRDVYKGIFFLSPEEQSEQTDTQKKWRAELLKVQSAFTSYEFAQKNYKGIAYVFAAISILVLLLAVVGMNDNIIQGILSIVEAGVLMFLIFSPGMIVKLIKMLAFAFLGAFVIELVLFQLPEPFFFELDSDNVNRPRGAFIVMMNAASPFAYVAVKGTVAIVLFTISLRIEKFLKKKAAFEGRG